MKRHITLRPADPFGHETLDAIRAHAVEAYPNECCGFVLPDGTYMRCANTHSDPANNFRVADVDTARALDAKAIAMVHSHPDGLAEPSYSDQLGQIKTGMTWGVLNVLGINDGDKIVPQAGSIVWWGDDLPISPLKGRKFLWGVFHCWSLYRDWLRLNHDITIPNFPCERTFIDDDHNIFLDNCERAGLRNLGKIDMSELRYGDMLVGHIKGNYPNHCGVFEGGDTFLHHPPDAASGDANLLRWWPHIDTVFRYDGLKKAPPIR